MDQDQAVEIKRIYKELEEKCKSCQRTWGMGFPVISLTLLLPYLTRIKEVLDREA